MRTLIPLVLMVLSVITTDANAQSPSNSSLKIAQVIMDAQGDNMATVVAAMIPQFQIGLKKQGATDTGAKVLAESFAASFNKPNLVKAFAMGISTSMSEAEQKAILDFLESAAGRKYLALSDPNTAMVKAIESINQEACALARGSLNEVDRASIENSCRSR